MKKRLIGLFIFALFSALPFAYNSCGHSKDATLSSGGSGTGNPFQPVYIDVGDITSQIFSFKMCVESIEAIGPVAFFREESMRMTVIEITKTGASLSMPSIPDGNYTEIKFYGRAGCPGLPPAPFQLINDSGTFIGGMPVMSTLTFRAKDGSATVYGNTNWIFYFGDSAGLLSRIEDQNSFNSLLPDLALNAGNFDVVTSQAPPSQGQYEIQTDMPSVPPGSPLAVWWRAPVGRLPNDRIVLYSEMPGLPIDSKQTLGIEFGVENFMMPFTPGRYRFAYETDRGLKAETWVNVQ